MKGKNINTIILTLSQIGLNHFLRTPTFKNLLHPNQIKDLVIGDNVLNVNNTTLGSLQRLCVVMPIEMKINFNSK